MRHARRLVLGMVVLTMLAAGAQVALAARAGQPAAGQAAAQEPQEGFVPVKDLPQQEQLPAPTLVMTAYGFVWAVLLVYVWTVWRRLMKVEREMHDLAARVGEKR